MTTRKMLAGLLLLAATLGVPQAARACGGCFAPPATVQVVTDHRMVLSLSRDRTVLWDQFRYTGAPEDFSWILPIPAGNDVIPEEADNLFLTAMDDVTGPILTTPTAPPSTCSSGGSFLGGSDSASALPSPRNSDVTVYDQRVVGPYEVTRLGSRSGMALTDWLRSNGYTVPAPIAPVIDHYVSLSMDFLAVRLRPNTDVSQMKPLRVTMPGYVPTLPLRMIAAGVAERVGLVLTVIAESRVEAMNFPNAEVREADLRYDFDAPTQPAPDFLAAFNAVNRANGGRAWITESAFTLDQPTVEQAMSQRCQFQQRVGQPCEDSRVMVPDARVAFAPFGGSAYVTRLRADLPASALGEDLVLAASDHGRRSRNYNYGVVVNTPPDPCGPAAFRGCATTPGSGTPAAAGLALAAALAGVSARRRRRA